MVVAGEADGFAIVESFAAPAPSSAPALIPGAVDHVMLVARLVVPGAGFVQSQGTNDADVLMLANFGTTAGERTAAHLRSLLEAAGLELVSVTPTRGMYSVLMARRAAA